MFFIQFICAWVSLYGGTLFLLVSSGGFFSFWVLLELNLVCFVGLLLLNNEEGSRQAVKYLVVQGLASSLLLVSVLSSVALGPQGWSGALVSISVFLKLGVAPFQEWFLSLAGSVSWVLFFLLSTLQKLPPLLLFSWFFSESHLGLVLALSALVTIAGTSKSQGLRQVMSYSAVVNSSWLLLAVKFQGVFFTLYLVYSLSVYLVSGSFFSGGGSLQSPVSSGEGLVGVMAGLFMLAGVPPFLGALAKFLLVSVMAASGGSGVLVLFISVSAWFLYIYLKLGLSLLVLHGGGPAKSSWGTGFSSTVKASALFLPLFLGSL